jgi:hypothetical protein
LLSAALDSIPDPPVVQPHHETIASGYLISPQQVADRSFDELGFGSPPRLHRVAAAWRVEIERAVPAPPLLKQASDSSPPLTCG